MRCSLLLYRCTRAPPPSPFTRCLTVCSYCTGVDHPVRRFPFFLLLPPRYFISPAVMPTFPGVLEPGGGGGGGACVEGAGGTRGAGTTGGSSKRGMGPCGAATRRPPALSASVLGAFPPRRPICSLSGRQGLTLVHFSAQRKHLLWANHVHFSACREQFCMNRLGV